MQTIIATELKNLLEKGEALLIDVRKAEEYEAEHIAGSTLIPLGEISVDKLSNKSKAIVLYCRSGKRSMAAGEKLLAQDPNLEVFSLMGGIIGWRTEELPTVTLDKPSTESQSYLLISTLLLVVGVSLVSYLLYSIFKG
ncbi:rhodanese-like domain-containing protein [Candidatus Phycorickettsia trachydisci]|nr:rhodanese-like domain-containing protein [Candidatus Phycorickettsia trachydisci]